MPRSQAVQNLYTHLSGLKLYNLHEPNFITAELLAYDVVFTIIEEQFHQLVADILPQTATPDGLLKWEQALGIFYTEEAPATARRLLLQQRLTVSEGHFTLAHMNNILSACGIKGTVLFSTVDQQIHIQVRSFLYPALSMEQIYYYLEQYLPAHLDWVLHYGTLTFDMLESRLTHWEQWDATEFTWNDFDQRGEELFPTVRKGDR